MDDCLKIVYLILAHKEPQQLFRLIKRLNSKNVNFLLHIDKKTSKKIYNKIFYMLKDFNNIYFVNRKNIYWGNFSMVHTINNIIRELFFKKIDFNYLILLTGQDYPIKNNKYIKKYLFNNFGKSFFSYFELPTNNWKNGGLSRINKWHHLNRNKYINNLKSIVLNKLYPRERNFPLEYIPFGGSSYWCITYDLAEYILGFVNQNKKFVNFFKYVNIPDEIFFHSIALNSKFKDKIVNSSLHYIDWTQGGPHPKILDKYDYNKIINSNKLFARKFDINVDNKIVDFIDEYLTNTN